jgi:hypothetical protein
MREDYLWAGLLAIPVGIAAIVGWVYFARRARVERSKMALLYKDGVAVVDSGGWQYCRWGEIEQVEVKPETRNIANTIVFAHKFTVTPTKGEPLVFGAEYFGYVELGLAVMERASAAGAECTGSCKLP